MSKILIVGVMSVVMSMTIGREAVAAVVSSEVSSKDIQEKKVSQDKAERFKQSLDKLVQESKITKDQEKKILDYFVLRHSERKVEREKLKNMTEEQRHAYFKANPRQKGDFLKELVSKGIISQSQSEEIAKVLPHRGHHSEKDKQHN